MFHMDVGILYRHVGILQVHICVLYLHDGILCMHVGTQQILYFFNYMHTPATIFLCLETFVIIKATKS